MTSEKHNWTTEDRMLLCTILKRLGFRYPTYKSRKEYTEIGKWHNDLYTKTANVMSIITGKTFSFEQVSMQMYKVSMYKQLKEGSKLQPSQFEMLKCMIATDLLDYESFYNMHYGWHDKYSEIVKEDEIIKKAIEIQNKRKTMTV